MKLPSNIFCIKVQTCATAPAVSFLDRFKSLADAVGFVLDNFAKDNYYKVSVNGNLVIDNS